MFSFLGPFFFGTAEFYLLSAYFCLGNLHMYMREGNVRAWFLEELIDGFPSSLHIFLTYSVYIPQFFFSLQNLRLYTTLRVMTDPNYL